MSDGRINCLNEIESAWLGAIIEGEGYIGIQTKDGCPRITIGSTDFETISTILRLVGAGSIVYRNKTKTQKPVLVWNLNGSRKVKALLRKIFPYLSSKRKQAAPILSQTWNLWENAKGKETIVVY